MPIPFQLEEVPEDAPSFSDTEGRRWHLLTPKNTYHSRVVDNYTWYGGCDRLCHWVHDDYEAGIRQVIAPGALPCPHQDTQILVPSIFIAPTVRVYYGRDWVGHLNVINIVPIPATTDMPGDDYTLIDYDSYLQIRRSVGASTEELDSEENRRGVERIDRGADLFWLFAKKAEHERHAATMQRPNRSPRWRERDVEIRRRVADLEAKGWTTAMLAEVESQVWGERGRFHRPWYGWEYDDHRDQRLVTCYHLGEWAERNGPQSGAEAADSSNDAVAELLGW